MNHTATPLAESATVSTPDRPWFWTRWREDWKNSFRVRLLVLGLLPLLVAFPFILGMLSIMGGQFTNSLLMFNLRKDLSTSRNYLDQLKLSAGIRIGQLAKSEKLIQLVNDHANTRELDALLKTTAEGSGLDFLVVATADGRVLGSSSEVQKGLRLPDSFVIRQATIGVANAAFERFEPAQLSAFSPRLAAMTSAEDRPAPAPTDALLINAGAHFPLSVNTPDAILLGGMLLNRNFALIEHMREIVYPVGSQPDDAEGITAIYLDDTDIVTSRQRQKGQAAMRFVAPETVVPTVMGLGQLWLGKTVVDQQSYIVGFDPIQNGDGVHIGMVSVAFPDGPYQKTMWLMLAMAAGLLALTMLALSAVITHTGRKYAMRLDAIAATMTAVGHGDQGARVPESPVPDELARLGWHFNRLLDTIAANNALQRAAQQTIAEEASRRRALFEHERDGVAILNPDGSVFEANPKCAAMLGFTLEELQRLSVTDWDSRFTREEVLHILANVGPDGKFFETVHRRKDGSQYPAEVSLSLATWAGRTFVLTLLRDISERKAAEAELDHYRKTLEQRVAQRTRELNERSDQLNTIFSLSPDGFVSFDRNLRISFANEAFSRMTGMDRAQIIGLDENSFAEQLTRLCAAGYAASGPFMLNELRHRIAPSHPDDHRRSRHLIELAEPVNRVLEIGIRLSTTENVSQVLYFRDVTLETEVDRMKSEFLSTAAHELRTPMTSIFGYTELLLMHDFDDETRQQFLTTVYRQSELMVSIINELLDLARIEARGKKDFKNERLPLQQLVAQAVTEYKPPEGRSKPEIADTDQFLWVQADPKKIKQVVLNIISNAYKYSPDGGQVTVRFCSDPHHDQVRYGFAIQDQGIGMDAEQLRHVCERFYRADVSGKIPGTGLGMSIVKEIVDLLGGDIEFFSEPGAGTTVTVWLPAAPAEPAHGIILT